MWKCKDDEERMLEEREMINLVRAYRTDRPSAQMWKCKDDEERMLEEREMVNLVRAYRTVLS